MLAALGAVLAVPLAVALAACGGPKPPACNPVQSAWTPALGATPTSSAPSTPSAPPAPSASAVPAS
ncbi:MAG: hypothetical protein NVSMB47_05570 [Polyangiales bacterium]